VQWTALELADQAGGRLLRRSASPIAGVFIDSRAPVPGALFVPIVAARDGHDFVAAAVQGGAAAVLIQVGRPAPEGDITVVEVPDTLVALGALARARRASLRGPVVSISGSNGKTTTRAMVAAVLGAGFDPVLCTAGNLNNHLGVPLTLLGEPHDPAATVIELGMNAPGENDHLASIVRPTIHAVTSVALEHLEFMQTIEAIAAAEAEPFAHVIEGGVVVVPSDEPLLAPHVPAGVRVLRCGPDEDADVRVVEVETGGTTRARLRTRDGDVVDVRLRLFGAHNARNAAVAMAIGVELGIPVRDVVAALERVEPVGDRGRVTSFGPHLLVADCYNANPGSVGAALRSLADLRASRSGRLVAVLGDMLELGPREAELHAEVGELAAKLGIDAVVGIGPRSRATVAAARAGGSLAEHFEADAIASAVVWVEAHVGDAAGAVLVKGSRGMMLERFVDALDRRD
jgi:UDP-N-acetylmuramoyl-tripeptide--D-alanyl-D-alanine ligase